MSKKTFPEETLLKDKMDKNLSKRTQVWHLWKKREEGGRPQAALRLGERLSQAGGRSRRKTTSKRALCSTGRSELWYPGCTEAFSVINPDGTWPVSPRCIGKTTSHLSAFFPTHMILSKFSHEVQSEPYTFFFVCCILRSLFCEILWHIDVVKMMKNYSNNHTASVLPTHSVLTEIREHIATQDLFTEKSDIESIGTISSIGGFFFLTQGKNVNSALAARTLGSSWGRLEFSGVILL